MNGARAEPCAKTSSAPSPTRMIRTGSNQNFLRTRIKPHSSPTNPRWATIGSGLELTFHALGIGHGRYVRVPAGRGAPSREDGRVAGQAADQANRQDDQKIDDAHEDRGRHLRDGGSKPHPRPLDRPKCRWRNERAQHEEATEREQRHSRALLAAPQRDGAEGEEGRADREPELAAVGRAQSSWNSRCHDSSSFHSPWLAFSSKKGPSTRLSMWVRMKHRYASSGVQTLGSPRTLNDVVTTTGQPVRSRNAVIGPL